MIVKADLSFGLNFPDGEDNKEWLLNVSFIDIAGIEPAIWITRVVLGDSEIDEDQKCSNKVDIPEIL